MINVANNQNIVDITLEYARDTEGRIVDLTIRNPIITIKYNDGNTAIIDTNLIYRNGYEKGYSVGKENVINKFKNLFKDDDESL